MGIDVRLNRDSIVNEHTGEVSSPSEFLLNLREIEVGIVRCDEEIAALKADLKRVKDQRETLVAQLRAGVRDGTVMPLLEAVDTPSDPLDADLEG